MPYPKNPRLRRVAGGMPALPGIRPKADRRTILRRFVEDFMDKSLLYKAEAAVRARSGRDGLAGAGAVEGAGRAGEVLDAGAAGLRRAAAGAGRLRAGGRRPPGRRHRSRCPLRPRKRDRYAQPASIRSPGTATPPGGERGAAARPGIGPGPGVPAGPACRRPALRRPCRRYGRTEGSHRRCRGQARRLRRGRVRVAGRVGAGAHGRVPGGGARKGEASPWRESAADVRLDPVRQLRQPERMVRPPHADEGNSPSAIPIGYGRARPAPRPGPTCRRRCPSPNPA